jgi:hypothetical protein
MLLSIQGKCTVRAHKETKNLISPTKNPEYGNIRIDSTFNEITAYGIRKVTRVAFLTNKMEDLVELVKAFNLKDGSILSGKIIRTTSYEPLFPGQSPKTNPTTGEIVLDHTGRPTYFKDSYTEDMNAQDVFINAAVKETVDETGGSGPDFGG